MNLFTMKNHLKVHSNEKPNACDLCPKSFKRASDLAVHKKDHHSDTYTFNCGECNQSFRYNTALKEHLRTMHEV